MTELFNIYQDNIKVLFGKITKILENANLYSNDKLEILLNEADVNIKESERLIKNMEMLSMTISSNIKETETNIVIRNYKSGVDSFKKRIMKVRENISQNKKLDSLLLTDSFNQKEKLINNDEVIWSSYDKLEKAKRSAVEMENITIDVARELDSQSEKMKHIGGKLNDMNKEINLGTGLVNRMMKMQRRNKLLVAFFSVILITILILILFFKITTGQTETTSNKISTAN